MCVIPLRLGRFRFTLRAETEARLPRFKGSTLRGAFGNALKCAVCIRRDLNCDICLVRPSCIYTHLFETLPPEGVAAFRRQKYAPHPYVLEAPLEENQMYEPGERLTFGLTLIGRAIDYLPYVIFAIAQAGHRGLGQRRGQFLLESVVWRPPEGEDQVIYDGASQRLKSGSFGVSADEWIAHRQSQISHLKVSNLSCAPGPDARTARQQSETNPPSSTLCLAFLTPMRLRVQKDLQDHISFELLIRSLLRRLWHLVLVHGEGELSLDHRALIARAKSVMTVSSALRWLDWERYSHRQRTKMRLGGLVGEVEYGFANAADVTQFLPLLILGELLHVGTGTTFGLGKVEIRYADWCGAF
ncbi:MAG TPA: CRISPR system precrRNA processing endoribonuclease RAMP protein Cas6 [Blastocatellia bacterium]|nr:CRISPR system precrRNA processing endoribonuclease RAMP protein Cas6 [Blastocatellia bacterium]